MITEARLAPGARGVIMAERGVAKRYSMTTLRDGRRRLRDGTAEGSRKGDRTPWVIIDVKAIFSF